MSSSDTQKAKPVDASYGKKIMRDVFSCLGAKLGLAWIAVIAFVAVFAPFLANSHPLLLSVNDEISSPALRFLTSGDMTILGVFICVVVLYFLRLPFTKNIAILALVGGGIALLSVVFVNPPQLTIYEQYRVNEATANYDWVIRAPIPYSPKDYIREQGDTGLEAPLSDDDRIHLMGTEENGADVLSRMIHASRIALAIGFIATGIAMFIGVILGGLMGYFSGIVDMIGMRLVEIFEAVPTLFLLLIFVAFFERSLYMMMVIIGITGWPGYARYVRAEFLRLRQQEFVQAAIVCGLPLRSILFRHMLPNGMAPILVAASFGVASAILAEATLSFLGLGLVDDPSWGQMLNQSVQSSTFNWWMAAFPGGAIFLTVFAYNLIGESMRDAIDPHMKRKS